MRFWGCTFILVAVFGVTMPDPLGWILLGIVAVAGLLVLIDRFVVETQVVDHVVDATRVSRSFETTATGRIPEPRKPVDL